MKDLVEKLRNQLGDPNGDFPAALMIEGNEMKKKYVLYFQYRKKNKDGSYTQKKYEQGVVMKFNPFTGEKL
jgi:hypothetical protein